MKIEVGSLQEIEEYVRLYSSLHPTGQETSFDADNRVSVHCWTVLDRVAVSTVVLNLQEVSTHLI